MVNANAQWYIYAWDCHSDLMHLQQLAHVQKDCVDFRSDSDGCKRHETTDGDIIAENPHHLQQTPAVNGMMSLTMVMQQKIYALGYIMNQ